jgi:hypothetical protein
MIRGPRCILVFSTDPVFEIIDKDWDSLETPVICGLKKSTATVASIGVTYYVLKSDISGLDYDFVKALLSEECDAVLTAH